MKSIYLRRFFIGVPTIIIDKGKINYKNMKKFKMDINDLLEQARINGYFDLSEIEYGIMEANGIMSFKLKDIYDTPTNKDLNINTKNIGICANIIIDGKYMKNNISNMNKNIEWVENKIKDMGYNINNILLATLNEKDEINIYLKEEMKDKEVLE